MNNKVIILINFLIVLVVLQIIGKTNYLQTTESLKKFNDSLDQYYETYLNYNYDSNQLIRDNVPEEYEQYFIDYTSHVPHLRPILLAIAKHESANWTAMRSFKPNRNKTYDRGPMGLNDNNIRSSYFRNKYFPIEQFDNPNITYMIAGINFFIKNYNEFGINAIYIYNTGRYRYLFQEPLDSTLKYFKVISTYIESFNNDLESIRLSKLEELNNMKHSTVKYTNPIIVISRLINFQNLINNYIFSLTLFTKRQYIVINKPQYVILNNFEMLINQMFS